MTRLRLPLLAFALSGAMWVGVVVVPHVVAICAVTGILAFSVCWIIRSAASEWPLIKLAYGFHPVAPPLSGDVSAAPLVSLPSRHESPAQTLVGAETALQDLEMSK